MRVEQERRHAERKDRHPEVRHPAGPDCQCHVEQHNQRAHAQVDARARETRVQDRERDARRREATASSDVPRTTEGQVRDDRVRRDLGREHLESGRQRAEVLREAEQGLDGATLNKLCKARARSAHNDGGQISRTHPEGREASTRS